MNLVHERMYLGSDLDCRRGTPELSVVHACKSPCHQTALGYRKSLPSDHPHYLTYRERFDLFLNIIDPPVPLFMIETFVAYLAFARECYGGGSSLFIHCNKGESRAPSLALLFMAKEIKIISDASFPEARAAFTLIYPQYRPGGGIQQFLTTNWKQLV